MHHYARRAYDMGIRYIGGCCGYEPYHIRAISEELEKERGKACDSSQKHGLWGEGLRIHTKPWVRARARRDYWEDLKPASGRPFCPSLARPDAWGCTAGHKELLQKSEKTTDEEIFELQKKADSA